MVPYNESVRYISLLHDSVRRCTCLELLSCNSLSSVFVSHCIICQGKDTLRVLSVWFSVCRLLSNGPQPSSRTQLVQKIKDIKCHETVEPRNVWVPPWGGGSQVIKDLYRLLNRLSYRTKRLVGYRGRWTNIVGGRLVLWWVGRDLVGSRSMTVDPWWYRVSDDFNKVDKLGFARVERVGRDGDGTFGASS